MKKEFTMSLYANKESLEKDKKEFLSRCSVIVSDNDGCFYMIPYGKIKHWADYLNSEDCRKLIMPVYAEKLEESIVAFENYTLI